MAKIKTAFFCQNCGYESVKWLGQCPSCNQWNTFVEELIQKEDAKNNGWKNHNADKRANRTIAMVMKRGLLSICNFRNTSFTLVISNTHS